MVTSYNYRFRQVWGVNKLGKTWTQRLEAAFESVADTHPLKVRHKGSVAYTDKLEAEYPGYIHFLYGYAEHTIGNQSRYEDIARTMNKKSAVDTEGRPATKFSKYYLRCWFITNDGTEQFFVREATSVWGT